MLTYDEIAEGDCEPIAITFDRALSLVRAHASSAVAMLDTLGDAPTYDLGAMLRWLGY